jgi:lipoprotein NlpD
MAANHGIVVYSGSGLPAYGKLLIIKHGDTFLSAYAHNSRLLVATGTKVKVGEKIAEIGRSGTTHNHLHFEIRKKGRPVNPMSLLPKK